MNDPTSIRQTALEPQQERARRKRNALLAAGQALFAARGYDPVTAKEIAAQAGVAVGSFYRYFADKKQLLLTLVEDRLEDFLPAEIPPDLGDPQQVIEALIHQHVQRVQELGVGQALNALVLRDPEVAAWAARAQERALVRLEERLEQLRQLGRTWPDLNTGVAAWATLALVQRAHYEGRLLDPAAVQDLAQLIARIIFPPQA